MTAPDTEDEPRTAIDQFTSSDTDEWATPPEFVRPLADAVGGFDLDPCSGAEDSPVASQTYTEDDDGLAQAWHGTVWVNPPYSDMEAWTRKAISESKRDDVDTILYLCKGDSSTNWWHEGVAQASAVAMLDGRLSFGDGENSAPFCSHVFVFGEVPGDALGVLERRGVVFRADEKHQTTEQTELVA